MRERFPDAHKAPERPPRDHIKTGAPCLDRVGIPRGTLTEIIGTAPNSGGGLLIASILHAAAGDQRSIVLIDGRDAFDPATAGPEICRQLLWVRCRKATEAIKSADLLLRDGNLPLVIMDLQLNPSKELHAIPGTTWFRLRNLAEKTASALVALTPIQTITSAHLRLQLETTYTLADTQDSWRRDLQAAQATRATRQRQPLRQSA